MTVQTSRLRVGLIGYGGIGRALAKLAASRTDIEIAAILARRQPDDAQSEAGVAVVTSDLAAWQGVDCDVIVECAGHEAVRSYVPALLAGGTDCVIASVGALADPQFEQRLWHAAAQGGARLIIPAGAIGGLDLIAAARLGGLSRVCYQSRKPPRAWRGSPAEAVLDLASVVSPVRFFQGSARDAALQYPQNANVAAAVALAGLGLDRTEVELLAVPDIAENRHAITVEGAFGTASFEIAGKPLPGNPKTSYLAALSLLRAVTNEAAQIII